MPRCFLTLTRNGRPTISPMEEKFYLSLAEAAEAAAMAAMADIVKTAAEEAAVFVGTAEMDVVLVEVAEAASLGMVEA